MAYYDNIAKQWHAATGYKGGLFKERVLNEVLLKKVARVADQSILELGAGNGYFLPPGRAVQCSREFPRCHVKSACSRLALAA